MMRLRLRCMQVVLGSAFYLAICAVPASGFQREIQVAADTVAEKLAAAGKRTVAVVDFTDLQGQATELGRFLAEELSVALASGSRPLEVVDRTHLKVLVQEHKLSATGLIDPATAKKLGQVAGVDALVTGTLTPFGDTIRLTLKVLDTSTARIVAAATAEIPKTKAIEELVAQGVSGGVGPSATEPERRASAPAGMPKPVEWEGVRFTLKHCVNTGGAVQCEVLVENLTESSIRLDVKRTVRVSVMGGGSGSRIGANLYDNTGNQYAAVGVALGQERNRGVDIHPGVPLAARLSFSAIPTELKAASLSIDIQVGWQSTTIIFRNASVTR